MNLFYLLAETKKHSNHRALTGQYKGISHSSGATDHIIWHGQLNWLHPQIISVNSNFYDRKVWGIPRNR